MVRPLNSEYLMTWFYRQQKASNDVLTSSNDAWPVQGNRDKLPTKFQPPRINPLPYQWCQRGENAISWLKKLLQRSGSATKHYHVTKPVESSAVKLPVKFSPSRINHLPYQWRRSDKNAIFCLFRSWQNFFSNFFLNNLSLEFHLKRVKLTKKTLGVQVSNQKSEPSLRELGCV